MRIHFKRNSMWFHEHRQSQATYYRCFLSMNMWTSLRFSRSQRRQWNDGPGQQYRSTCDNTSTLVVVRCVHSNTIVSNMANVISKWIRDTHKLKHRVSDYWASPKCPHVVSPFPLCIVHRRKSRSFIVHRLHHRVNSYQLSHRSHHMIGPYIHITQYVCMYMPVCPSPLFEWIESGFSGLYFTTTETKWKFNFCSFISSCLFLCSFSHWQCAVAVGYYCEAWSYCEPLCAIDIFNRNAFSVENNINNDTIRRHQRKPRKMDTKLLILGLVDGCQKSCELSVAQSIHEVLSFACSKTQNGIQNSSISINDCVMQMSIRRSSKDGLFLEWQTEIHKCGSLWFILLPTHRTSI